MTSIAPASYEPDVAISPGETIREMLEEASMSQAELAQRMGRPANKLNEIVKGKRQITANTALELELALGLPASFWINLEKNFQLTKARLAQQIRLEREAKHLAHFPLREMAKFGWITRARDAAKQTREMLQFFGIATFEQLKEVKSLSPAWRKGQGKNASEYALAAWLREGIRQAQALEVGSFDPQGLRANIEVLRAFTRQTPDVFEPALVELCAQHGVAVRFVPHLPKSYVNGAAYWLNDRVVIQLSLRFKWADIFWFSFFHELGHVLLHLTARKSSFLDENSFSSGAANEEREADCFAADTLIPPAKYAELLSSAFTRPTVIRQFAEDIGVSPGIVVGRLQFDKHLQYSRMVDLKTKFAWRRTADSKENDPA